MILVIDNYDSFTFNLVQYFLQLHDNVIVYKNDQIGIKELQMISPQYIVLSPGPGNPDNSGVSLEVIQYFKGRVPILGVCLGHQIIAQAFGGKIVKASMPMHGKVRSIYHDGKGMFEGLVSPYSVTRYHSLIVDRNELPSFLEISATSETGEIMGIRHKELPIEGVQFHPESVCTEYGHKLLKNFLQRHSNGVYK